MKRVIVERLGGPSELKLVEEADPSCGPGEVLIEVEAAGCNFFDALLIAGRYQLRPEPPFSPGAEVAGVVAAVGAGVSRVAVGDRALAILPYGGFASHVVVPEGSAWRVPEAMSCEHAAALPIAYQTSYFALHSRAALQPGESLVVHAAAGGVGLAAVQLGRALGATVYGTAGSDEKCALAREHGATEVWNYRHVDWAAEVKRVTGGRGADVLYDPVGGEVFERSLKCIAFGGRLLVIGFASGHIPSVTANRILLKNIAVVGLHWGAYQQHAPGLIDRAMGELFALYERGAIAPLVSKTYPLAEAGDALVALHSRDTVGKVLLTP